MSGVEVAGMVLGVLPILISALEKYRDAQGPIISFRQWKGDLPLLLQQLRVQHVRYQEVQRLILYTVASNGQVESLIANPGGPLWQDLDIELRLRESLETAYPTFVETISTLEEVLRRFSRYIKIEDDTSNSDVNLLHRLISAEPTTKIRVKPGISQKKLRGMILQMDHLIRTLETLAESQLSLGQTQHSAAPSRRRYDVSRLREIQGYARKLYRSLERAWKCQCQASHWGMLLLEQPDIKSLTKERLQTGGDDESHFTLLLSSRAKGTSPGPWREIVINGVSDAPFGPLRVKFDSPGIHASRKKSVRTDLPRITFKSSGSHTDSEVTTPADMMEISDLCATVSALSTSGAARVSLESNETLHQLSSVTASINTTDETPLSLGDLFNMGSQGRGAVSRKDRYRLSVILSWSVLQLYSTPWLREGWTKDDIVFLYQPLATSLSPNVTSPFVTHSFGLDRFPSAGSDTKPNTGHISFLTLAIVLLELYTAKSFAQQKTTSEAPRMQTLASDASLDSTLPVISDLMAWLEVEKDELSSAYAGAIEQCVKSYYASISSYKGEEEDSILQDMLNGVIQPLQEEYSIFSGSVDEINPEIGMEEIRASGKGRNE